MDPDPDRGQRWRDGLELVLRAGVLGVLPVVGSLVGVFAGGFLGVLLGGVVGVVASGFVAVLLGDVWPTPDERRLRAEVNRLDDELQRLAVFGSDDARRRRDKMRRSIYRVQDE
jgi:hypothetical protein